MKENVKLNISFHADSTIKDSLVWKIGKNEVSRTDSYQLPCDKAGNSKICIYKGEEALGYLEIVICDKPTITFTKNDNVYDGEFGFDDGAELTYSSDYQKMKIGKTDYTVPWLGLLSGQEVTLNFNVLLDSKIRNDKNFRVTIASTNTNAIKIDGQRELTLNYQALTGKRNIRIKSSRLSEIPTFENPDYLYAIDQKGDTLGKINILCSDAKDQKIVFVYVKHNASSYRTDINKADLIHFANNSSHNQLFIRFILNNDYHVDTLNISDIYSQYQSHFNTQTKALGILFSRYQAMHSNYQFDDGTILFFITNFNFGSLGGGMIIEDGTGLVNFNGMTKHICHELGHAVDLRHPFCCTLPEENDNSCLKQVREGKRCKTQGTTRNNYMDYITEINMNMYYFYQWKAAKLFVRKLNK